MSPISIERLYRPDGFAFWIWNGIVTALMVVAVLLAFRHKSRWRRGRRLLAIELRLEEAWEQTKASLQLPAPHRLTAKERAYLADVQHGAALGAALGTTKDGVLSNLGMGVTQQTVQQSKISCDI
jgi:hypothetical protein